MGQGTPGCMGNQGHPGDRKYDGDKKYKMFETTRVGLKQRRKKGSEAVARLPTVTSLCKCHLHILKVERIKGYLLMKEEFAVNQECLRPQVEKNKEDHSKFNDLRDSSMSVGNLEKLIDDYHAIVSSLVETEYYVTILSFVDKDQLELDFAIFMHNKKVVTVKPCLWNGMKRPCYLFARKFYPEALHNLMQLFSNYTLI
ncbi:hypothetical protein C4D60_Mb02t00750 [Musa balbisiana]|uniref:Uncharacterized protein n=1 Tax=Musa balbisiana TaxID=52838 RepID=A0A4S8I7A9_MUSBA|nr:hypothetical protein C4D60_Mb02t00750 [Musa balbisiana]